MFFVLSKLLWLLTAPVNVITLALSIGGLLLLRGRSTRGRGFVLAAGLGLLICGVMPSGTLLLRVLENRFPSAALGDEAPTGIIVLGGAVDQVIGAARGQVAITNAATRITEAVVLARRYPGARIVYSGGSNALVAEIGSEAADAKRLWVSMGVDPSRITLEDRSRNTVENAEFSRDLLQPKTGQRWLLVTSAYHMPRAMGLFRAAGFPVEPVPVDYRTTDTWRDFEPNRDVGVGLARFDMVTREWIGLAGYWFTGKIASVFPGP